MPGKGYEEFSNVNLTASGIAAKGPCELASVDLCPSAGASQCIIYDGTDATGRVIHTLYAAVQLNIPFNPPCLIHCEKGIYITHTANVTSTFVQFRLHPAGPAE